MLLIPLTLFLQVITVPQQLILSIPTVAEKHQVVIVTNKIAKKEIAKPVRPTKIPTAKVYSFKASELQNIATQSNILTLIPRVKAYDIPGEKHKMVLALKCPSELADITTPTSFALHKVIDAGFGIANIMPFVPYTFEQTCM